MPQETEAMSTVFSIDTSGALQLDHLLQQHPVMAQQTDTAHHLIRTAAPRSQGTLLIWMLVVPVLMGLTVAHLRRTLVNLLLTEARVGTLDCQTRISPPLSQPVLILAMEEVRSLVDHTYPVDLPVPAPQILVLIPPTPTPHQQLVNLAELMNPSVPRPVLHPGPVRGTIISPRSVHVEPLAKQVI